MWHSIIDTHCESITDYHWHAGRKRIIWDCDGFSEDVIDTNNGCIHSLTVTVQSLLQPPENVICFTNDYGLEWICSPGFSLAEYFILDFCPHNGTSCCSQSSNTTSELNTTSDRVKTFGTSTMLPSGVITPMSLSGTLHRLLWIP